VRCGPACGLDAGRLGPGAAPSVAFVVSADPCGRGRSAVWVAPAWGRVLGRFGLRRFLAICLRPLDQNAAPASGALPLYACWPKGGADQDEVYPNAAARFGRAHVCTWCQETSAICAPFGSVPAAPWSG
jgi:hypothetical protein